MSDTVLNDRQRRFAELLVEGESTTSAYKLAGYAPNSVNPYQGASKLANTPAVQEYVNGLRDRLARSTNVTRAALVDKQLELAELARESGQYAVSSSCLSQVGRMLGFYTEQLEITSGVVGNDGRLSSFTTGELRQLLLGQNVADQDHTIT